jgi:hypothetical protein
MTKITPKENYLRLAKGEVPDFIPLFNMGFPGSNGEAAFRIVGPSLFEEIRLTPPPEGGRYDLWGVKIVANEESMFGSIPEPGNFILDDITKWDKVLKLPKLPENIDWEALAKKDREAVQGFDPEQSATMGMIGNMPFQTLISFMGFTEGLIAMIEEPEACEECLNYMVDLYEPIVKATVEYYDIDMLYLLDDTAAKYAPFISTDLYRKLLKPIYTRLTKPAVERGIAVEMHNCGKCEAFIDDMIDFGVRILDPAQAQNDLVGIKKKYDNKFALAGCYEFPYLNKWPNVTEEEVRESVRECIDTLAPGGGFAFSGGVFTSMGDPMGGKVNGWITEEAYNYGRDYYLKH